MKKKKTLENLLTEFNLNKNVSNLKKFVKFFDEIKIEFFNKDSEEQRNSYFKSFIEEYNIFSNSFKTTINKTKSSFTEIFEDFSGTFINKFDGEFNISNNIEQDLIYYKLNNQDLSINQNFEILLKKQKTAENTYLELMNQLSPINYRRIQKFDNNSINNSLVNRKDKNQYYLGTSNANGINEPNYQQMLLKSERITNEGISLPGTYINFDKASNENLIENIPKSNNSNYNLPMKRHSESSDKFINDENTQLLEEVYTNLNSDNASNNLCDFELLSQSKAELGEYSKNINNPELENSFQSELIFHKINENSQNIFNTDFNNGEEKIHKRKKKNKLSSLLVGNNNSKYLQNENSLIDSRKNSLLRNKK